MGSREDIQRRDDVLVYTSPVLEEDIEVTGAIKATLYAASSAPDTDFIVTLSDVYPDGHIQYLTHDIVRVTYRDGYRERKLIESRQSIPVRYYPLANQQHLPKGAPHPHRRYLQRHGPLCP